MNTHTHTHTDTHEKNERKKKREGMPDQIELQSQLGAAKRPKLVARQSSQTKYFLPNSWKSRPTNPQTPSAGAPGMDTPNSCIHTPKSMTTPG